MARILLRLAYTQNTWVPQKPSPTFHGQFLKLPPNLCLMCCDALVHSCLKLLQINKARQNDTV